MTLDHVVKANDVFTKEEHVAGDNMAKPDWVAADGTIFAQEIGPWHTAQQWALKYKLISLGDDPASYFTNDYLPK